MEDFLNEINDDFIQARVNRLKQKILIEKKTITNKIISYRNELLNTLNFKLIKKSSIQNFQNPQKFKHFISYIRSSQSKEVNITCPPKEAKSQEISAKFPDQKNIQNCFFVFERACGTILETYFPILIDDEFLSLQSEESIDEKLLYLNIVVEKTVVNLIKKLTKQDQFLDQAKKESLNDEQEMQKQQSQNEISCQNIEKNQKIKKRTRKQKKDRKKSKNTKISTESSYVMQKWLLQNFQDPYPTLQQKNKMAQQSGLTVYQVNNWFINARQRVIKKYLKKDNVSNQLINKNRKNSSQDQEYECLKRQKKGLKRQNNSQSHLSEGSLRGRKLSSEKHEMIEQS